MCLWFHVNDRKQELANSSIDEPFAFGSNAVGGGAGTDVILVTVVSADLGASIQRKTGSGALVLAARVQSSQ